MTEIDHIVHKNCLDFFICTCIKCLNFSSIFTNVFELNYRLWYNSTTNSTNKTNSRTATTQQQQKQPRQQESNWWLIVIPKTISLDERDPLINKSERQIHKVQTTSHIWQRDKRPIGMEQNNDALDPRIQVYIVNSLCVITCINHQCVYNLVTAIYRTHSCNLFNSFYGQTNNILLYFVFAIQIHMAFIWVKKMVAMAVSRGHRCY